MKKDFAVLRGGTPIHACLAWTWGHHGSNIAPRLMADIYDRYVAGDLAGSLEAQYRIAPIRMAFTLGSYPTILKESLELLGIEAGPCYAPVGPMTEEARSRLIELLKEAGVLT